MMPQTSANKETHNTAIPARSNRSFAACSSRDSAITQAPTQTATIASGTLRKKTQRQLACSTTNPATIGPEATAAIETPAQIPIACCSSRSGKAARMIASVEGMSRAPAQPCTARKAISAPIEGAKPQAAEASAKPTTPHRKMRLRPNRSPAFPALMIRMATASR